MRIVVVSDSHAPRRWKGMPPALLRDLDVCDLILHAGDVCVAGVLDELAAFAPVRVVMGNNDGAEVSAWGAVDDLRLDLEGIRLAMIHDSGAKARRGARMRDRFPNADLVVFGHSHIPMDIVEAGVHLFNPGSVSDPRRQPHPSYGVIEINEGTLHTQIIEF